MSKVLNEKSQPTRSNLTFTLPLFVLTAYAPCTVTTRTFATKPNNHALPRISNSSCCSLVSLVLRHPRSFIRVWDGAAF